MYKVSELSVDEYLEKMSVCDFPGPAAGLGATMVCSDAFYTLGVSRYSSDCPVAF